MNSTKLSAFFRLLFLLIIYTSVVHSASNHSTEAHDTEIAVKKIQEMNSQHAHVQSLFYGNWCGPGRPASGQNPPAKDDFDAACRTHDKCYGQYGYFNCKCDSELTINLSRVIASGRLSAARHLACARKEFDCQTEDLYCDGFSWATEISLPIQMLISRILNQCSELNISS
ncbi:hypothetical protein BC936DRAFT_140556 [Jimgerdemannia flammicorona]|uniref:Uncharacterized protein n=1 Tax=Jimgerdemannia flammicorona TaxID=994334 RepID=A0A433DGT4_9FUNG|nr:hypothetical protein BC936DRAFT_140556 [Jimgerdemannia flammicorona]